MEMSEREWKGKNWGTGEESKRGCVLAPTATNTPRYENVAMKQKERRDWVGEIEKKKKKNRGENMKRDKEKEQLPLVKINDSQWIPGHGVQLAMVLPYLVSIDW